MKICKFCVHYEEPVSGTDNPEKYSRCTAIVNKSVVTGKLVTQINYCDLMRGIGGECGQEAKLYREPDIREEWQRDEPQGTTNWDSGWNAIYSEQEGA